MRAIAYSCIVIWTTGVPVWADPFCDRIINLMAPEPVSQMLTLPSVADLETVCTRSLSLTGAQAVNCAFAFEYRSGAAKAAFDATQDALTGCLGAKTQVTLDQAVNHPDFYDLRVFRTPHGEVGLSLKDKGALQQTYVFVRFEGLPQ